VSKEMIRNFDFTFSNAFASRPEEPERSKMSIAFVMHRYELASNRRSKTKMSPWCFRYPSTENSTAECCPIVPSAHFPCRPPAFAAASCFIRPNFSCIFRSER
jgi:hypothetical protein